MAGARLCLVDGTYELFRVFYGAPSRMAPTGVESGATVALGRGLAALAKTSDFTHYAVAFDTVIESFRNELFSGYKTGAGIDPTLLAQFPLAERMARALGFVVLSMVEFEADDALATAAAQFADHPEVEKVVIASPDKDLMQCVGGRVVTWDRMRDKTYAAAGVEEKLGVCPASIPDFLALVGDVADGIPGVPRWGARSAAVALRRYGHLESIPRVETKWDVPLRGLAGLLTQLRENEEDVLLYRQLATLRRDVPLGVTLDDLLYRGPHESALAELRRELGLREPS